MLQGRMPNRIAILVTMLFVLVFVAATAHAQCEFGSGTGTKLKVPMVRAYEECAWSASNVETEFGWDACSPVKAEPPRYRCSETHTRCSSVEDSCPERFCGGYESRVCTNNSDCPTFFYLPAGQEITNGICEDHPGNVCEAEPGVDRFQFAPDGSCTLSASSKVENDCSRLRSSQGVLLGLPARACHVTKLRVRCRNIVDSNGVPIDAFDGTWYLRTLTRATFDDGESGDMTQLDFPVQIAFGDPHSGSVELETSTAEALLPILGPIGAALPPCTNLQPIDFRVMVEVDGEEGRVFAKVGLSTQP
jgi:hypothetical protein